MKSFGQIEALAGKHHGGPKGISAALRHWQVDTDIGSKKDAQLLAGMAKAVFSSGFSWEVIEKKWPGFEAAFDKFEPKKVAAYGDDKVDALLKDTRIVRNGAKIMATIENARFVVATAKQHGSFAKFLANWPEMDQVGLMDHLETRLAAGRIDVPVFPAVRGLGCVHPVGRCGEGADPRGCGDQGTHEQEGLGRRAGGVQSVAQGEQAAGARDQPYPGVERGAFGASVMQRAYRR